MKIYGILRLAFVAAAAGSQVPAYRQRDASDSERGKSLFVQSLLETHVRGRGRYAYAPAPRRDQGAASGFRLVEDLGCREPGDDADFCRAAGPKEWTPSEIEAFRRTLGELKDRASLAGFLGRVEAGGFTSVTRQREIAHWRQGEGWRRRYYPNSLHSNRDVVFADAFFRLASDERRWATLHLLAHTYDFSARHGETFLPVWSVHPWFLKRAGFTPRSDGRWDYRGMPPAQRARFFALFDWADAQLVKADESADPRKRDAAVARVRRATDAFAARYRAPTFHSMLNPYESFADWTAFVALRERKAAALDPEMTRWISENVLR